MTAETELREGAPAPAFALQDQHGNTVRLEDLRGQWVVLYFYPKDDTPGCTAEACSFRDAYGELAAAGAVVLGVSGDDAASHRKFAEKHGLPFPLLVDEGHAVAKAYGAFGVKRMYGREYEGVLRQTFLIDPEGRIARVWRTVKPADHAAEVLTALRSLRGS
ncbi:MAG: thioredoxin-dependent thiol peroxidase [Chloroflexota bacterium]|nr:thioredoxin-dependent thiol peroxidase [Dehalococcoidia bacterium]MDW8047891.1 thioredoxin-dependent thiol peroxidase [Chloroflexota bacterium]